MNKLLVTALMLLFLAGCEEHIFHYVYVIPVDIEELDVE